jgi:hypothetical protein
MVYFCCDIASNLQHWPHPRWVITAQLEAAALSARRGSSALKVAAFFDDLMMIRD